MPRRTFSPAPLAWSCKRGVFTIIFIGFFERLLKKASGRVSGNKKHGVFGGTLFNKPSIKRSPRDSVGNTSGPCLYINIYIYISLSLSVYLGLSRMACLRRMALTD